MTLETIVIPAGRRLEIDDCWNRIGIRGDRSCPRLEACAHCRNCPVYSGAALSLLDREVPADYADERAEHFAKTLEAGEDGGESFLIFRIADDRFALPVTRIQEIAELRPVRSLPHRRNPIVRGVVNFRGELIIVVAIEEILGIVRAKEPAATTEQARRRLVVLNQHSGSAAFHVDEALGTHICFPCDLKPLPATVMKSRNNHLRASLQWRDHRVGCVDSELLLRTLNRNLE